MTENMIFCIVHFNNTDEVIKFCEHLNEDKRVTIIVTDNSGNLADGVLPANSSIIRVPSNLGYLNGCAYGLNYWLAMGNLLPEYICICNTDIIFPKGLSMLFESDHIRKNVGCIAPKVILTNGHNQNPNIIYRLTKNQINFLCTVFQFRHFGTFYMLLSRLKNQVRPLSHKNPQKMSIYSPHGSCFFLTRAFFENGGNLKYGGFIYSEEIHIAEQVLRCGLETLYDPRIEVLHHHHATLKFLSLGKRSEYHRQSLTWVRSQYFS